MTHWVPVSMLYYLTQVVCVFKVEFHVKCVSYLGICTFIFLKVTMVLNLRERERNNTQLQREAYDIQRFTFISKEWFWKDEQFASDLLKISGTRLIRVFTVCYSICNFF